MLAIEATDNEFLSRFFRGRMGERKVQRKEWRVSGLVVVVVGGSIGMVIVVSSNEHNCRICSFYKHHLLVI